MNVNIKDYNDFLKKTHLPFIMFCIAIITILLSYFFLKNTNIVIKILIKIFIVIVLLGVIYNSLLNVNKLFENSSFDIKKYLLGNYLFILLLFLFTIFIIFKFNL